MKKLDSGEFNALLNETMRMIENAEHNRQINTVAENLITTLMDSEFASLWIYDASEASLVRERSEEHVRELSMLDQRGVLAKSFLTLSGGIYNYLASEKEYRPETDNPDEIRIKSKIILPLIDHERLLGIATAYSSIRHKRNFSEDDMEIFEAVTPFLINVIYRMHPEKQSEGAPEIYLSDRLKESAVTISHQVEHIRQEQNAPAAADDMLGFLANSVHDIRTPANALYGFLELLEGQLDDNRLLKYVRNAKEGARLINDLTTSILDRVSTQRERAHSKPQQIAPVKFFAQIAEMFSANMSDKRLSFPIYIDPALPKEISIDAIKLKRVVMNLIGNACKFTPTGKSVEFSVVYEPKTGTMHVTVADTGIGIAEENQQAIFDAFRQATDETAERFGGTGLGLSISAQYVRELGGKLELESALDKGSRFFFTIPLQIVNTSQTFETVRNSDSKIAILMSETDLPVSKNIIRTLLRMGLPKTNIAAVRSVDQVPSDTTHLIVFQSRFDKKVRAFSKENNIDVTVMEEIFLSMKTGEKSMDMEIMSQYSYCASSLHAMLTSRRIPKVLVVDDDHINIELIKAILEEEFCTVETAMDGQYALDLLKKGMQDNQPFSLMFLDKHMPKVSGDEVLREVRSIEKQQGSSPIYAVSISGDPKARTMEDSLFDAFVGKPFNKKEIKKTLKVSMKV